MLRDAPARLSLGAFPTRIEAIERFDLRSASGGGSAVWIKRDDQTGSDLSGNKVRKLEYLLAEALAERCDVVITCGGVQSNHCRATAVAARRLGMDSVLFLRGERPEMADGNLLLDALVGARLVFITPEEYARRADLMREEASRLAAAGRRPYVIPEGGSNALGSWGYVAMLDELVRQGFGDRIRHLVCATGSAGTLAGLHLGVRMLGLDLRLWGVAVCDNEAYFRGRVAAIAGEFRNRYPGAGAPELRPEEITVIEGYRGPGYAKTYPRLLDTIRRLAREEGILLDPVYTGKAFLALCDLLADGRIPREEEALFLHTGGVFSLFPYRGELVPAI